MFKELLTKALSRSDKVVKRGAKDAKNGKNTLPAAALAKRARDAKQTKNR